MKSFYVKFFCAAPPPPNLTRLVWGSYFLGTPVVPGVPFYFGVSLVKLDIRKKGTFVSKRLLGNLALHLNEPC